MLFDKLFSNEKKAKAERSLPYVLLVVDRYQPLEGALFDALSDHEGGVFVYCLKNSECITKGEEIATPLSNLPDPSVGNLDFHRFVADATRKGEISTVVLVGMAASAFWSTLDIEGVKPVVIMPSDAADFSSARVWMTDEFLTGCKRRYDFFFEDEFGFTNAIAKGSLSRHFTYDLPVRSVPKYLAESSDQEKIALLVPDKLYRDEAALQKWEQELKRLATISGFEYEIVSDKLMYTGTDFAQRRNFPGTLKYRLGQFTKVGIAGFGRNTNALLLALKAHIDKVVVEDTYFSRRFKERSGLKYKLASGANLIETLIELPKQSSGSPVAASNHCLASQIREKADSDLPALYEEMTDIGYGDVSKFSVFFSVGNIQFETPGARHQRVRNLFEALKTPGEGQIFISANPNVLSRRLQLIEMLLARGAEPTIFYGENSTSPISNLEVYAKLEALLALLRKSEAKIGWFVRDAHYMFDDIAGHLAKERKIASMRAFGWVEADLLSKHCDVLFAPSLAAADAFRSVLGLDTIKGGPKWKALPPGVRELGAVPESSSEASEDGITFVYTGGLNAIYQLDAYVDAAVKLAKNTKAYFDFVVREAEAKELSKRLRKSGGRQFRVLTVDFDWYQPRTTKVAGALLLAGEYAGFALPYKTMSYLERGMPILAYEGTSVGDFVAENKVGIVIREDEAAIDDALSTLAAKDEWDYPFKKVRRMNSWAKRASTIRRLLPRT